MAFDIGLLKKHPYATGGVVIVGGLVVFYLLSRQSASAQSGVSSDGGVLAADTTLGQAQAAAAIQTNAQNAAIQQSQIAASSQNLQTSAAQDVADTQTIASLLATLSSNKTAVSVTQSNNDAATLQAMNAETTQQNIYGIQESGLQDQINQAEMENANNNATSLAALKAQLDSQTTIATTVIGSATTLAQQQQADIQTNTAALIPTFGKQYNSALDANNAAAETLTVLSGGNPYVANTGVVSSASSVNSGNVANSTNVANIVAGITKLGQSVSNGLFA